MLLELLATGFFVGKLPVAPGTFGTLLAVPFVWFFSLDERLFRLALAVLFFLGWLSAEWVVRKTGLKDPEEVVIDEVFGYAVAFLFVEPDGRTLLTGFVLFRLLDVFKPFPVNLFEHFPGGLGVMADDAAAGLLTGLLLLILFS
ncbi:MAG: phosphatidylglycerophosphatase A [Aquificae bacterium]|nr:phosphatidylglycerophosphatase A [Aquificota bacterium]